MTFEHRLAILCCSLFALTGCTESGDPAGGAICGNLVCEAGESNASCPVDCTTTTTAGGTATVAGGGAASTSSTAGGSASTGGGSASTASTSTASTSTGSTSTGSTSTVDMDAGVGMACNEASLEFIGQMYDGPNPGDMAVAPDGGCATDAPHGAGYDANIDDVVAAVPADGGEDNAVTIDVDIVEATVVATNFVSGGNPNGARRNFWIQDGNAFIQVDLDEDAPDSDVLPIFAIRTGQRISFTATEVWKDFDVPKISEATGFQLISEENDVFLDHVSGALTAADANRLVFIDGTVASSDGPCGGSSSCWTLTYNGGATVTFRSNTNFPPAIGDVVLWAGPVSIFSGNPQLNAANFSWFLTFSPNP